MLDRSEQVSGSGVEPLLAAECWREREK